MLKKEKVIDEPEFIEICNKYGLNIDSVEIYKGMIIASNKIYDITLFFNEYYNIIGVLPTNKYLKSAKFNADAISFNYRYRFYFLFNNFLKNYTLEDIFDLANRIEIRPTNQGHSAIYFINGIAFKWQGEEKNIYLSMIAYIKFISEEIKILFDREYQYLGIGYTSFNVYTCLTALTTSLENAIKRNEDINFGDLISFSEPFDIIKYDIISLLQTNLGDINLEEIADKLLNILNTPLSEVEKNKKEFAYQEFKDNTDATLPWNQEKSLTRKRNK